MTLIEDAQATDLYKAKQALQFQAGQGLFKHAIAVDEGGFGNHFEGLVEAHHAVGYQTRDCGLILSIHAHLWGAVFPLLRYGTEQQKKTYLTRLLNGDLIGGHAITEPQAGSDLNRLITSAETMQDTIRLNCHKRYITNTPIADLLVVYAREEKSLSAYIVHADDESVQFSNQPQVKGCQTAPMGDLILDHCSIPKHRQLGKSGAGGLMIQQALELERAFIFAGISGVMQWQLETVVDYARNRTVNAMPLGKNQAISHKIANMKTRLDTIQLWLKQCARLKDSQKRITLCSAQTKLLASEAFLQSSLDAVHILGTYGLEQDNPMADLVYDAMSSRLFSGTSEIQKNIIAS